MYKKLDEQTLARYCSQHDKMAEEELYNRYAVKVFALCRRYLRDEHRAKDLMLETLLQALDKMDSFRYAGEGSLYAWIRQIAINRAVNSLMRERWRTISLDLRVLGDIPDPTGEEVETIPPEKLQEWISGLPPMRKAVFNLSVIDGYTHKEIAEILGISEKGSSGMLAKAKKQVKERIIEYRKGKEQ